jgi:hypothetical protein
VTDHLGAAVGPATLMTIRRAKLNLYALLSDFGRSRAEGERLLALAREAGNRATEAEALAALGLWSFFDHDFEPALAYARDVMAVAEPTGAQPALAEAHLTTGWIHTVHGWLGEARSHLERAIGISRAAGDAFRQSLALSLLGCHETWAGAPDIALALQAESLRLAREHNLVFPLQMAFFEERPHPGHAGRLCGGSRLLPGGPGPVRAGRGRDLAPPVPELPGVAPRGSRRPRDGPRAEPSGCGRRPEARRPRDPGQRPDQRGRHPRRPGRPGARGGTPRRGPRDGRGPRGQRVAEVALLDASLRQRASCGSRAATSPAPASSWTGVWRWRRGRDRGSTWRGAGGLRTRSPGRGGTGTRLSAHSARP